MKVISDNTKHERLITLDGAPDMYTQHGRGGTWYSPSFLKVHWENEGTQNVWVGGMKRNKNGDIGLQDTGEWFSVNGAGYWHMAPAWVLDIIEGKVA